MTDANKPMTGELVTTVPQQRSVLNDMAARYGMEPTPFEQTVRAICMPEKHTREEFAAFLLVAKEYRLNPMTKEIYAFPKRGGGIVPIVSIDGWVSLVNSHPQCDGFSFSWVQDDRGEPISCTCIMYRKDRSHPTEVTEYLAECIRPTDPWKMKHRMLRHKTMIQAARYAFGFSGIYDEDEGAKIAEAKDVTPSRPVPPPPPPEDEGEVVNKSDHPVEAEKLTPADEADDFGEGDSGVSQAVDLDAFLTRLDEELASAETEDQVNELFQGSGAEDSFGNDEAALARAYALRTKHLDRVLGQGSLLDDMPDATRQAVKLAGTP